MGIGDIAALTIISIDVKEKLSVNTGNNSDNWSTITIKTKEKREKL